MKITDDLINREWEEECSYSWDEGRGMERMQNIECGCVCLLFVCE